MQVTYTNYVTDGVREIPFKEISKEEQTKVGNQLRRLPLETIGKVRVRKAVS